MKLVVVAAKDRRGGLSPGVGDSNNEIQNGSEDPFLVVLCGKGKEKGKGGNRGRREVQAGRVKWVFFLLLFRYFSS